MGTQGHRKRRICFVTGTRAEFGLMRSTLEAIAREPSLQLQLVATGMHLDARHGNSLQTIHQEGWRIDAVVPWAKTGSKGAAAVASHTGQAMAALARCFARLHSDVVLVVGDRVEAFAAAAAAHIGGRFVAHVHGGDRALGQVDDALRHAISKLAHVHFPATPAASRRLSRLGEDAWRIHRVGSPGIDGLLQYAAPWETLAHCLPGLSRGRYALVVLHPADADEQVEGRRAAMVLRAVRSLPFQRIVVIYPNNDPGARGIMRCWQSCRRHDLLVVVRDLPRGLFLALLRDAAVLVGNSSSGIIEAASFHTPVVDIGLRQSGRQRSQNVTTVGYEPAAIRAALRRIWHGGRPLRSRAANVYGAGHAGRDIARVLAGLRVDHQLRRKLIAY